MIHVVFTGEGMNAQVVTTANTDQTSRPTTEFWTPEGYEAIFDENGRYAPDVHDDSEIGWILAEDDDLALAYEGLGALVNTLVWQKQFHTDVNGTLQLTNDLDHIAAGKLEADNRFSPICTFLSRNHPIRKET